MDWKHQKGAADTNHARATTTHGSYRVGPDRKPGKHVAMYLPHSDKEQMEHLGSHDSLDAAIHSAESHHSNKTTTTKKSTGASTMGKTDYNDLFKSELGGAADVALVDCPHCESPITKSDLEKAQAKGAVTNLSGPKQGKSSAHVRDHNPEGGTMRGGDGRGQVSSSRGVPGAQKHDDVTGVQNSKGSRARKGGSDDASDDGSSSDRPPMKKSMMTVRGTEVCQYFDFGDAPGSDASIAKSILEAQGHLGQEATQPMDLNSDLSRLLI